MNKQSLRQKRWPSMENHRKFSRRKTRTNRSLFKCCSCCSKSLAFRSTSANKARRRSTTGSCSLCSFCEQSRRCLFLRIFVEQFLMSVDRLCRELGLIAIPTASALRKFARRLKARWAHTALAGCAQLAGLENVCVGVDGTGHSKQRGSKHRYRRIGKRTRKKDFTRLSGIKTFLSGARTAQTEEVETRFPDEKVPQAKQEGDCLGRSERRVR